MQSPNKMYSIKNRTDLVIDLAGSNSAYKYELIYPGLKSLSYKKKKPYSNVATSLNNRISFAHHIISNMIVREYKNELNHTGIKFIIESTFPKDISIQSSAGRTSLTSRLHYSRLGKAVQGRHLADFMFHQSSARPFNV